MTDKGKNLGKLSIGDEFARLAGLDANVNGDLARAMEDLSLSPRASDKTARIVQPLEGFARSQ